MNFQEFCERYQVTASERRALKIYLLALRLERFIEL